MEEVKDECLICGTKIAGKLVTATGARIEKIIESSHKRGDDIHVSLQRQYEANKDMTITCHHIVFRRTHHRSTYDAILTS